MFVLIFSVVISSIVAYFAKNIFRQLQLCRHLKGPPGWLFIGNGLELVNKSPIGKKSTIEETDS